jgi:hypothetical protein
MPLLAVAVGRSIGFCRSPDFWAIGAAIAQKSGLLRDRYRSLAPTNNDEMAKENKAIKSAAASVGAGNASAPFPSS